MKTVGIATIHGICNFGSLLQAYATQATIERLGYKSFIINYKYPNTFSYDNKLEQLFRETFIMSQAPTTEDRSVSTFIQNVTVFSLPYSSFTVQLIR